MPINTYKKNIGTFICSYTNSIYLFINFLHEFIKIDIKFEILDFVTSAQKGDYRKSEKAAYFDIKIYFLLAQDRLSISCSCHSLQVVSVYSSWDI